MCSSDLVCDLILTPCCLFPSLADGSEYLFQCKDEVRLSPHTGSIFSHVFLHAFPRVFLTMCVCSCGVCCRMSCSAGPRPWTRLLGPRGSQWGLWGLEPRPCPLPPPPPPPRSPAQERKTRRKDLVASPRRSEKVDRQQAKIGIFSSQPGQREELCTISSVQSVRYSFLSQ